MRYAILAEWLYIPEAELGTGEREAIIARLTISPAVVFAGEAKKEILNYSLHRRGYLGVPVDYGLRLWGRRPLRDITSTGADMHPVAKFPDPDHPRASEGQGVFTRELEQAARRHNTTLGIAPTGSGKTVVSLAVAARLGRRTLIIVPLARLLDQWKHEIMDKLGVPAERIGFCCQDVCEYEGRDFVIALIHSVSKRRYPIEFYRGFGTVIWDEAHVTGAFTFRSSLSLFRSTYRIALTATPHRRDGCSVVFTDFFGPGYTLAAVKALRAEVRVITYPGKGRTLEVDNLSVLLGIVAKDSVRNGIICREIAGMYSSGRDVLGISARVEQLYAVRDLLVSVAGVPSKDIGVYVASDVYTTYTYTLATKLKRNQTVFMKDGDIYTAYTYKGKSSRGITLVRDASLAVYSADVQLYVKGAPVRKRKMVSAKVLDHIRSSCPIILATYGMFEMAVDVPRLSGGIDMTPRASGIQAIGRIRRPLPGKDTPVWVTIVDTYSALLHQISKKRITEYVQSNCVLVNT